jgi:hypothetical protein
MVFVAPRAIPLAAALALIGLLTVFAASLATPAAAASESQVLAACKRSAGCWWSGIKGKTLKDAAHTLVGTAVPGSANKTERRPTLAETATNLA